VVWDNEGRDLALLEVPTDAAPLRVATQQEFRQGEPVTLIGNPLIGSGVVVRNTIGTGQLAAQVRIGEHDFYQIAGAVNPGSSGGPVLDQSGTVVAVVAMKATRRGAEAIQEALTKLDDSFAAYFGKRRPKGVAFGIPAPALAEIQANVPAAMRRQAAGETDLKVLHSARPSGGKRQRLALLSAEEAQFLARELQSRPVQAIKDKCSEDLPGRFQKVRRSGQLDQAARRSVEQLHGLVNQMQRCADDPQSDYFAHSAKVLGFMSDLKSIAKRLEEQFGMQQR
jgi:hypothetical protein